MVKRLGSHVIRLTPRYATHVHVSQVSTSAIRSNPVAIHRRLIISFNVSVRYSPAV